MKKLFFYIAITLLGFCFYAANAQSRVNISIQPVWGPVGYNYVDYYYMPDIETYYYVPNRQYIYLDNGVWITTSSMPARYSSYDIYHMHKVVINQPKPYLKHKTYYAKYVNYKGKQGQPIIRDSHDSKYFINSEHPEHGKSKAAPTKSSNPQQHKKPQQYKSSPQQKSPQQKAPKDMEHRPSKREGHPKK
jgi:hypothetical protein